MSRSRPSREDELESSGLTPYPDSFGLYRHRKAGEVGAEEWHGYYWARRTEGGDYEKVDL